MHSPVIQKKLISLQRCIERIKLKRPTHFKTLLSDLDIQDIISINLERAIQLSVDIAAVIIAEKGLSTASTMAGNFQILIENEMLRKDLGLKMQKSVGFRNISVHEYHAIDWKLVFDIIHNHLINFEDIIKAIV